MNWIYFVFYLSLLLALLAKNKVRFVAPPFKNGPEHLRPKSYSSLFVFLFFGILLFVVCCREGFVDTLDYRSMYTQIGPNVENAFNNTIPRVETGFLFILAMLNKISSDPQLLLAVFGIVTVFCFSKIITYSSVDITCSLILFSCNIWLSCMNGLRQVFVASILSLFGYMLISTNANAKKSFLFICIALLLSTLHTSALLCVPFYFMAKGKFFNIWVKISFVGTVLLLLFSPLYDAVFNLLLSGLSYSSMLESESTMGISRLFISAAPIILFFICHLLGADSDIDEEYSWMMNLVFFGFLFSLLSLKMVYFSRMRMYFNIFSTVSLPFVIKRTFTAKSRLIATFIVCALYIAVFLYQLTAYGDEIANFTLFFEKIAIEA